MSGERSKISVMSNSRYREYLRSERKKMELNAQRLQEQRASTIASVLSLSDTRLQIFKDSVPGYIKHNNISSTTMTQLDIENVALKAELTELRSEVGILKKKVVEQKENIFNLQKQIQCPVCMQDDKNIILDCGHGYCDECFSKLKRCAMCDNNNMEGFQLYL